MWEKFGIREVIGVMRRLEWLRVEFFKEKGTGIL